MHILETDSLSNQDIHAALEIGSYTADAARKIIIRAFADQVAGSGDYIMWATLRLAGAGSAYRVVPITTATVAAGVTAISFISNWVPVSDTDVLKVYLTGLAGDTATPDTKVEFWDDTVVDANMVQINGDATDGYNATLKLNQLDIQSQDEGSAAVTFVGDAAPALNMVTVGDDPTVYMSNLLGGPVIKAEALGAAGAGIEIISAGDDPGIKVTGAGTGHDIELAGDGVLNGTIPTVDAIKVVTDKLADTLVFDDPVYQFTANALELGPGGGTAPTVEQIRAEMDSNSTQLAAIVADTGEIQTELADGGRTDLLIDGIKTKTDYLPSVVAGGSGGVFIAGTNAATTVTTALTTTFTGNLTGSVASVTGLTPGNLDAKVSDVKTKTDYLPSATAGSAGGVFIAGSNAATSITTALTADITGDLSGSVGSVTGSVGSVAGNVDGSVASVSGAVGSVAGNVDGSVASVTGAVGSVSGAVGSVAGNVDGSVASVTGAVGSVAGNVDGSVASVTGAVGSVTGAVGSVAATVSADLVSILGTALSETAGLIAAAFSKFFNKATPTGTVNSLPDAVAGAASGVAIVGSLMGLTDDAITSAKFDESSAYPLKAQDTSTTILARAGDQMTLKDDAITSAKFDESSAYPLAAADTGATQIARVGADADTLETLSDQIDATATVGAAMTLTGDYDAAMTAAQAGDAMTLEDDAITSAKFDESSAYPLAAADTGSTQIARVGADSDTLETLSDQLDSVATATNLATVDGIVDDIKAVTEKLDTTLAADGLVYDFTAEALAAAPTGGSAPTVEAIRAEIDSNSTQLAAIVSDTDEIQTELADGGRTDLLIDGIAAKTVNLPAIPAAVGSAMTLADDAITSAKFDESSAYPLAAADTGATQIARVGADADTLETLSDQIDTMATATNLATVDGIVDDIKVVTAKLADTLELDTTVYRFTANALEEGPSGGTPPTVEAIRAEIDTNSTQLAAIVADTGELQTELADGGRTDLLIDDIAGKTVNLPASPAAVGSPMTLADDAITSAKFDESSAYPVKAADTGVTQIARVGADADTLETLSDQLDVVTTDVTNVMAASIQALGLADAGSEIDILRGNTFNLVVTGFGNITTRTKLWFTIKRDIADADTGAVVMVREVGGLIYLNGAAGTAAQASITVTNETTGAFTVTLLPAATTQLTPEIGLLYDLQALLADGTILSTAPIAAKVSGDVTRATS